MGYWDTPGKSDEWFTPLAVFEALGCEFDLDVAAPIYFTEMHVPARRRIICNALQKDWDGFVWMNPPFEGRNGIKPWLKRFFSHGNGIALMPDRTSTPWFWEAWRYAELALFTHKISFIRPDGSKGKSPSNGTALMSVGDRGNEALTRAASRGFGILAEPLAVAASPSD